LWSKAMGSAFGAGAGADALQEVLKQKYLEQVEANRAKQDQERIDLERQRYAAAQRQQAENSQYLNEQRAAAAEKARAETAAKADHQNQVTAFLSNPSLSPAVRQWGQGAALGFNQLSVHDYEAPDAHQAHLDSDARRKSDEAFDQHKRTRDYDNAHPAPLRSSAAGDPAKIVARLRIDDPTLPLGSQRYLAQIASKHGGDVNSAAAELSTYLNDPQTQSAHPNLSPVKAFDALKNLMGTRGGASGGGDDLDALISQAFTGGASGDAGAAGQRSGVPGAARLVGARIVAGSTPPAQDAQLVDRARQVLQQGGYAATPENIQKFLSNPANRQRLGTGAQ
jgi:hypothetical protein